MTGKRFIVLLLAMLLVSVAVVGKPKTKQPALTPEEQMRLDYYLYAALNAMEHKEHAKAFFLLELCNETAPDNPTVCSIRGAYIKNLTDAKTALPLLKKAYEGSPDDYWYQYAVTTYELGQHKTTMDVLKQMEKRQPKDLDILELHQQILRREGQYKQALAILDKIDKLTGEPTPYSVLTRYEILCEAEPDKSQKSKKSGSPDLFEDAYKPKPARAVQVLDKYLMRNPDDSRIKNIRTDIAICTAIYNHDQEGGIRLIEEAIHNADMSLPAKLQIVTGTYAKHLGVTASQTREYLQDLREQYPFDQPVYQALRDFEKEQGNTHAALDYARILLTMNPTDSKLRENVSELMSADDSVSPEEMGEFIEQSYQLLPDDPKWGYFKALRLWQRGDIDSTLLVLERALNNAEEPTMRLTLLVLYGDLQGAKENYEVAFATYDEVLKLAPEHLGTLNNYAWSLAISGGDLKKAEKMSQITIQKDGNNPTFLDTYAWILHLQGQNTLALFYIKKALEYAGDNDDGTIREHYNIIGKIQ